MKEFVGTKKRNVLNEEKIERHMAQKPTKVKSNSKQYPYQRRKQEQKKIRPIENKKKKKPIKKSNYKVTYRIKKYKLKNV